MAFETTADPDATTYADVATADAVAETQTAAVRAVWDALSDEEKLAGLTARTLDVDTLDWIGDRAIDEQALEWPRTDAVDSKRRTYSDDTWPNDLIAAVIQQTFADALAGRLGSGATVNPVNPTLTTSNLKRQKIGPLEKEYFAPTATAVDLNTVARFAPIAQNLLAPLIRDPAAAASEWGTGCARRAS